MGSEETYETDLTISYEIRAGRSTRWRTTRGWLERKPSCPHRQIRVRYPRLHHRHAQPERARADQPIRSRSSRAPSPCWSKTDAGVRPVRLLGVSVHNFGEAEQTADDDTGELRLPFS